MPDPTEPDPFGIPLGDVWNDVPLLREIQRVLLSSSGPVNWELARQVGIAAAAFGAEDGSPTDADRGAFEAAVRVAELRVADATGLEPPSALPSVRAVRRSEWVQATLQGLRPVLEPAVDGLARAVTRAQREALPESAAESTEGMTGLLSQLSPLLLGAQVGSVLGSLAQQVFGQYDVAIPRSEAADLVFVVPNVAAFERDWSLDPTEFRTWVALHEVTHRFELSRPWVVERFRAIVEDYSSTLRLDVEGLQRRLETLDPSNPESMRDLVASEEGLFGPILDDEQRLKLGRIQAFVASVEGYGDHTMHAIGGSLLGSYARIDEAMRRYRETEQTDPVLDRILGIAVGREHVAMGRAFCDRVVELSDEATLARMWSDADALPSLPELEEPRLWLARSA
jgi:putative hydrolase